MAAKHDLSSPAYRVRVPCVIPFATSLAQREKEQEDAHALLRTLSAKLEWHGTLDSEKVHESILRAEREASTARERLQKAEERTPLYMEQIGKFKDRASVGLNPRHWFSTERAFAKQQLAGVKNAFAEHGVELKELYSRVHMNEGLAKQAQEDLDRYRSIDPLQATSTIRSLQLQMQALEPEIAQLRQRSNKLDARLAAPLQHLFDRESQLQRARRDLDHAQDLEARLSRATSGWERRQAHEECERMFDQSRPNAVIRSRTSEINALSADIQKLRARIAHMVKCATREVRVLIIDGNNLCYQQQAFVGLTAFRALVPALARDYEVRMIFDSGIRGQLKTRDGEIRACFPEAASVHVVASKVKADETILDSAGDERVPGEIHSSVAAS